MSEWLSKQQAAALIDVSHDTIERRAIPWTEQPVRFKVRFKYMKLDAESRPLPRYYRPDVEAFLLEPKKRSRPGAQRLFESGNFDTRKQP